MRREIFAIFANLEPIRKKYILQNKNFFSVMKIYAVNIFSTNYSQKFIWQKFLFSFTFFFLVSKFAIIIEKYGAIH